MIQYLEGKVLDLDFHEVTILTSWGVGYWVWIHEGTYTQLALEEHVSMYIYHHITENNQSLFGFLEKAEKKVFTELIKISWIWGKVAMQILSLGLDRLVQALADQDNKTIESVKWIWKKMAEKIVIEMKDKDFWITLSSMEEKQEWKVTIEQNLFQSILDTLVNMGYDAKQVEGILKNLPEEHTDAGTIIPFVIRELS